MVSFCKHFDTTIHCEAGLNDNEKLMYMYLRNALNNGPARFVIQGLTRMSKSYDEVIMCLKELYNPPR